MYQSLLESWSDHRAAWIASTTISLVVYAAAALAIPFVLASLPADHFTRPPHRRRPFTRFLRTIVGLLIVAAGVAMLFLPGPGIVTIVLGLSITGGELSARGMRKIVCRPRVLAAINAMRVRRGREPLLPPYPARREAPDDRPHDST